MLLDNYLTYDNKVIIAIVCSGFWIYYRTDDCYKMIPREHFIPVMFVMTWTYLNYYEPLFLPIGLIILIIYGYMKMDWMNESFYKSITLNKKYLLYWNNLPIFSSLWYVKNKED
jgi:hypothetical protein